MCLYIYLMCSYECTGKYNIMRTEQSRIEKDTGIVEVNNTGVSFCLHLQKRPPQRTTLLKTVHLSQRGSLVALMKLKKISSKLKKISSGQRAQD